MLKNYLKTTLRHIWKNKGYSILNIFGLAIGIACSGLIFLWMEDELNYDNIFLKKDQLYMVRTNQTYDGKTRTFNSTPGLLAPAIKTEIPGIVNTCRFGWGASPLMSYGDKSLNQSGMYADASIFDLFTLQFVQGNAKDAFRQVNSIVISEKMAKRLFGNEKDVVGKVLKVDNKDEFAVTGVIADLPANSTFQYDWYSPFEVFRKSHDWLKYWGANGVQTFVELAPGANVAAINKQLYNFIAEKKGEKESARPFLFGMNDWHLRDNFEDGKMVPGGRITYVHLFAAIAWIIILIACINFMNLATARSEKRAREVGVRKVLGAGRSMLISQFIGEALGMSVLAAFAGLLLISLVLPAFNTLVEKQLTLGLDNPLHMASLIAICLICGLVAGSYPALYLSGFNPAMVLKGGKGRDSGAAFIRKGLVVVQFTVSIMLIISTIIIYQQIQHIKHRDLGYDKNNLVKMDLQGNMQPHFSTIRQDLLNTGVVGNAALSSNEILYTSDNTSNVSWKGKDPNKEILVSVRSVSPEFISTWGMQLIDGRDFHDNAKSDSTNVLITESLAALMGQGSMVGQVIRNGDAAYHVVGVIKDLVYGDMYGKGDPVIFFCAPEDTRNMYIRIKQQVRPDEALARIGAVMRKDNPSYPFSYEFVDDQFNAFFKSEALTGKLAWVFAGLAIIISCLGLFGLAAYTAEKRTREVGIRKVLGASTSGIAGLLSKDFMLLVLISTVIAFPIAWWAMHSWLQGYAYRISISWWVFGIAGMSSMVIALGTISFQAIRAATANPAKSLRSE